jgi:transposase
LREISVAEQRYLAVLAVLQEGLSVTAVAEKMGVSRQILHRWLAWYAGGGIEELADRSHRPHGCPHQMDPAVEVRLAQLRQAHPAWGPDRLRYRLAKERVIPLPSRAGIARALVRRGLIARANVVTANGSTGRSARPVSRDSPLLAAKGRPPPDLDELSELLQLLRGVHA